MAKYTAATAVHATLTASTVDVVTLTDVASGAGVAKPTITVVNRSGTAEIYFTVSVTGTFPAEPTVGGDNTYVVPAAISSLSVPVYPGVSGDSAVVKVISSAAAKYSVQAL